MSTLELLVPGHAFSVSRTDLQKRCGLFAPLSRLSLLPTYEVRTPVPVEDFQLFVRFVKGETVITITEGNIESMSSLSEEFSVSLLSSLCLSDCAHA
jgi:hypothetical protein